MSIHRLKYKDIKSLTSTQSLSEFSKYEPNRIHKNFFTQVSLKHLISYSYQTERTNGYRGMLTDKSSEKVFREIAKRIKNLPHSEIIIFLQKNDYFLHYNLFFAVKIIKGLMKSPVRNFAIVKEIEEKFFITKEQKMLLWIHVFDGVSRQYPQKSYALFEACKLIPFATTVTLGRVLKMTTREKLSIAA